MKPRSNQSRSVADMAIFNFIGARISNDFIIPCKIIGVRWPGWRRRQLPRLAET